ncbi:hypothetical protein GALMADRAFT_262813 [Galerina marginata CBS 339.88]|uniref:Uncharacterized protein n=1 Tax=Galerina marginata (strain CBS 339.88) TaxID=685588 RepID=A0A067TQY2_GALM3|nr:hypothetical protein GALMADRAFT_262813 [Galerina marginata CBS 339.88]
MSFASPSPYGNPHPDHQITPPTPSQFVDDVVDRYRLSADQRHDLHLALQFGSDLSYGDLLLRISAQAQMSELRNEVFEQRNEMFELRNKMLGLKNEVFNISNMTKAMVRKSDETESVLNDARAILTKWDLSRGQKTNIIAVTKNSVCNATITSYETLDTAVKDELMENAKRYGFDDVFERPDRVAVVKKEIGNQCRSVKKQYRAHILHSVDDKATSLSETVQLLYRKYSMEANKSNAVPTPFTARVALLRRFACENIDFLRVESSTTEVNESESACARKRQRPKVSEEPESNTRRSGCISKENSFWYRFDKFLAEKLKEFGDDLASEKWKEYIAETLILDDVPLHTAAPLLDIQQ